MTLDTLIVVGIVVGAAAYLYRKFAKNSKDGGCSCSSGGGGCGGSNHDKTPTSCNGSLRRHP